MKRERRANLILVVIGLSIGVGPRVARGQEPASEGAFAQMLYRQGRALIGEGKVAEACPKFAASYRLDAATETALHLAPWLLNEGQPGTPGARLSPCVA